MRDEKLQQSDIESLLARLAPPRIPDEAFGEDNEALRQITGWKKSFAIPIVAGLQTEPAYYANGIRLDWLQRLVVSKSNGQREPDSDELSAVLNRGMSHARVLQLEDPSETLFCSLIATPWGNFQIFNGQWQIVGPYTQTLLDAFLALPDSEAKKLAIVAVCAILRLSDELTRRSNVDQLVNTGGDPQGEIQIPNDEALKVLADRVRFDMPDIIRLGLAKEMLSPFTLKPEQFPYVSDRVPGNTPLEFHPLLDTEGGIVVASPAGISLAIRSLLIFTAKESGLADKLSRFLLVRQQEYSEISGFWPMTPLRLGQPDSCLLREAVWEYERGRFLQVIQVPTTFDQFPETAFGGGTIVNRQTAHTVASRIHKFWQMLAVASDCRSGETVLLMSGWGNGYQIEPPIDRKIEPKQWQLLCLGFSDATTLGACDEGKLDSIIRVIRQVRLLEDEGFSFQNQSGIVNLFGFWRLTDGNFVPEHTSQLTPPCEIVIPTDCLLSLEAEAVKKLDVRTLPLPVNGSRLVQRIKWGEKMPIYGSVDDAAHGRLLGAVVIGERVWWVECAHGQTSDRRWRYRVWEAVLEWLATVGSHVITTFPEAYPPIVSRTTINISNTVLDEADSSYTERHSVFNAVKISSASDAASAHVHVGSGWRNFLHRRENDAEVELVAAVLEAIADPAHPVSRANLRLEVLRSVGSQDWRQIHVQHARTPIERLVSCGLTDPFHRLPLSAAALAKCGSVWRFRERSEGADIDGEEECRAFLAIYRDWELCELIQSIKRFDRRELVVLAARSYQAARAEQRTWRMTIRARRAINGLAADADTSQRQHEINAIQRAAKIVCEVAACEAPDIGGLKPGRMELDDIFAMALLLFGTGQIFAAVRSGLMRPKLRISPTGDLLSDRSAFDHTLAATAELLNKKTLDHAADRHATDHTKNQPGSAEGEPLWDSRMRAALEAEYGGPETAFVDLQFALIQLAEERKQGVFMIRRSELREYLDRHPGFPKGDHAALLERLTLPRRESWMDTSHGLSDTDIDISRFDRRFSLINRPLLALDNASDPIVLVAPIIVSDAAMYTLSGLRAGTLNNQYWVSTAARQYAGERGRISGEEFEMMLGEKLRSRGMEVRVRCKLSTILNQKVDKRLGDIDVLALSPDRKRVWIIEAKNLRLCRTEAEIASRLSEYRGQMVRKSNGTEEPDKMLRHIRRVQYLRKHRAALCPQLGLIQAPEIRGLLVVDSPQPMHFFFLDHLEDRDNTMLDAIDDFCF